MFNKLLFISNRKVYWLALLLLSIALEASALFYQYVLEYYPCVLCIHVRIWVMGMMVLAIAGLWLHQHRLARLGLNILMTVVMLGLFERSYMLLGVERGFVFGSCDMSAGLPDWFALDKWFPTVFKVWEACGYTPELLFGITMAEALIVMSALLLLFSVVMVSSYFIRRE